METPNHDLIWSLAEFFEYLKLLPGHFLCYKIQGNGGSDGTRTRDLRRDRPAL